MKNILFSYLCTCEKHHIFFCFFGWADFPSQDNMDFRKFDCRRNECGQSNLAHQLNYGIVMLEIWVWKHLLPFELTSKDGNGWGGTTRGNISSMFQFDLKKKDNTLSILCFLVPTITFKTKPQNNFFLTCDTIKNIETIECKCNVHNLQVISTRF